MSLNSQNRRIVERHAKQERINFHTARQIRSGERTYTADQCQRRTVSRSAIPGHDANHIWLEYNICLRITALLINDSHLRKSYLRAYTRSFSVGTLILSDKKPYSSFFSFVRSYNCDTDSAQENRRASNHYTTSANLNLTEPVEYRIQHRLRLP